MRDTIISFYLKANRIHIYSDVLRRIGEPARICFMISENGENLLITPYDKRDFKSHGVPQAVYTGTGCMEISSFKLCRIIAKRYGWNLLQSYRVPGKVYESKRIAVFNLDKATAIEHKA